MFRVLKVIIQSKSKTFLTFCFCFIVGASIASLSDVAPRTAFYFYIIALGILLISIIAAKQSVARFILWSLLFALVGAWRYAITIPVCTDPHQLCFFNDHKITLMGRIAEEPDVQAGAVRYVVAAEQVINHGAGQSAVGKVWVTARRYPAYQYGDAVQLACRLQTPMNDLQSTFRFDKYLAKEEIWSVCSFPEYMTTVPSAKSSLLGSGMRKIFWFKSKIAIQLDRLWPQPESSLMAGLLYGSKSGLPKELLDDFSKTGVTHIVAVSGFNVTIIATTLMTALIAIGFWRRQAYWLVVGVLALFVVFSGASASVVRAAVMGVTVLTAGALGRLSQIGVILVFTAAVMLWFNPYLLVWDAGFQLSFLATLGLVYISPVLSDSFSKRIVQYTPKVIMEILVQTLSAIIATTPLILYQFGRLSIVAPLVNVLILWTVPLLMLGGFAALVASFIFYPLGQVIAWIFWFGLRYVIFVVQFFGNRSWSALEFAIPAWCMVVLYAGIVYSVIRYYQTKKTNPYSYGKKDFG